jgi:hypothetical protein
MNRMDAGAVGDIGNAEIVQVSVVKKLNRFIQPARWFCIDALRQPVHAPEQLVTKGIQGQAAELRGGTPGNSHCERELRHFTCG